MHKPPRADFLPYLILADTANDYFFCEYSVFFKNEFFFWMNIVDLKKKEYLTTMTVMQRAMMVYSFFSVGVVP